MKVKDLVGRAAVDEITVTIQDKAEPRAVKGGSLRVCDCTAVDDSGSVTLTLWNDECDQVNAGDTVTIKKGWVNEYQGKKQLSRGRFGEMNVTKGSAAPAKSKKDVPEDVLEAMDEDII